MNRYQMESTLKDLKLDAKSMVKKIRFWRERSETPYCSPVEQKTAGQYADNLKDELTELLIEIEDLKSELLNEIC